MCYNLYLLLELYVNCLCLTLYPAQQRQAKTWWKITGPQRQCCAGSRITEDGSLTALLSPEGWYSPRKSLCVLASPCSSRLELKSVFLFPSLFSWSLPARTESHQSTKLLHLVLFCDSLDMHLQVSSWRCRRLRWHFIEAVDSRQAQPFHRQRRFCGQHLRR